MTDEKKSTETKAAAKPKSTAKTKTAPKAKAKSKAKPKAAPKVKARPKAEAKKSADTAPLIEKDSKTESYRTQSPKRKSSTPLILLLVSTALILTTIYKFNDERNSLPVQADSQISTAVAVADSEPASPAIMQANPVNNNADTPSEQTPYQQTPLAYEKTQQQAGAQAQERATNSNEIMRQHRQAFEKEIQSKQQQYKAIMEAHQKKRAETVERQKTEFQRYKQHQLETRKKAQEIQKQIFELHEKLHQLMQESHVQYKP